MRPRQHTANQLDQLREFAQSQGWTIVQEYEDHETGSRADRINFQALMKDASQRRFDVVLFWALDRFTREGALQTLQAVAAEPADSSVYGWESGITCSRCRESDGQSFWSTVSHTRNSVQGQSPSGRRSDRKLIQPALLRNGRLGLKWRTAQMRFNTLYRLIEWRIEGQ